MQMCLVLQSEGNPAFWSDACLVARSGGVGVRGGERNAPYLAARLPPLTPSRLPTWGSR